MNARPHRQALFHDHLLDLVDELRIGQVADVRVEDTDLVPAQIAAVLVLEFFDLIAAASQRVAQSVQLLLDLVGRHALGVALGGGVPLQEDGSEGNTHGNGFSLEDGHS